MLGLSWKKLQKELCYFLFRHREEIVPDVGFRAKLNKINCDEGRDYSKMNAFEKQNESPGLMKRLKAKHIDREQLGNFTVNSIFSSVMNRIFFYKSPGASNKMSVFIILLSLLAFTRAGTTMLTVVEGEPTELNFSYPCDSARVTLRQGMRAPFYDSPNQESLLLQNQELAFQVETESNNCLLQLKINPVVRSDEGGYILTAYDGDGNILEDPRVGLRVDYPPGKASCEWAGENVTDDWGSLRCKAPAGSMPGQIACYQNGIRLPPVTTPTEVGDILQQTVWVWYPQTAFCCAFLQGQPIDRCACDDFVWDPLHSGNITDPCSAPQQDSTSPESPKEDNIYSTSIATLFPVKETNITELPATNNVYTSLHRGILSGFVLLVLIIVVECVLLTATCRKIRKITEQKNINEKQRSDYESVPSVEVQL